MDNLLAYILLLAPGFIVMLINGRVGPDLKGKHSDTEKVVMAILFSIPVLICNLFFLALKQGTGADTNIAALQQEITSLSGLVFFLVSSVLMAIVVYYCWEKALKKVSLDLVNKFRKAAGKADVNEGSVVWEDAFHGIDSQAVCVIFKDLKIYGSPINSSEVISDERALLLQDCREVEDIVVKYNVPVAHAYIDTKSGMVIEIYDSETFRQACEKDASK